MQHSDEMKWDEYKILVIDSLDKLDKKTDTLEKKIEDRFDKLDEKLTTVTKDLWIDINKLDRKIAVLETKAFMLGLLGGGILSVIFRLLKIT